MNWQAIFHIYAMKIVGLPSTIIACRVFVVFFLLIFLVIS